MTARLPDWDPRFTAYLAQASGMVREGREQFCALFAAGAVEAVTGDNPAATFRGRYSEVATALEETIDSLFAVKPTAFAQRGDLAWHDGCVGAVIGGEAIFIGEHGEFVRIARREWQKAWAVG